jgi:pyruvate dehydrogenase E2 component (dihydrolipoamide acetyltransferase)
MELRIPELGDNVAVATVVGVLVREGDRVAPGQPLLELETDKAVMEVPAEAGGVVKRVLVQVGEEVRPGQPFLELAEEEAAEVSQVAQRAPEARPGPRPRPGPNRLPSLRDPRPPRRPLKGASSPPRPP